MKLASTYTDDVIAPIFIPLISLTYIAPVNSDTEFGIYLIITIRTATYAAKIIGFINDLFFFTTNSTVNTIKATAATIRIAGITALRIAPGYTALPLYMIN